MGGGQAGVKLESSSPTGPAACQAQVSAAPLCPQSEGQGKPSKAGLGPVPCLLLPKGTPHPGDPIQQDHLPCPPQHPLPQLLSTASPCLFPSRGFSHRCFGPLLLPASLVAQRVKRLPTMRATGFDPWDGKLPWRRKWQPGKLQPTGSQRVGHN